MKFKLSKEEKRKLKYIIKKANIHLTEEEKKSQADIFENVLNNCNSANMKERMAAQTIMGEKFLLGNKVTFSVEKGLEYLNEAIRYGSVSANIIYINVSEMFNINTKGLINYYNKLPDKVKKEYGGLIEANLYEEKEWLKNNENTETEVIGSSEEFVGESQMKKIELKHRNKKIDLHTVFSALLVGIFMAACFFVGSVEGGIFFAIIAVIILLIGLRS